MTSKEFTTNESVDRNGDCIATTTTLSTESNGHVVPPMEYYHHLFKTIQHLCNELIWRSLSSLSELEAYALNRERVEADCFCLGMPFHYNYISHKNNSIDNDHNYHVSSEVCNNAKAHSHTQKQCTNTNWEEQGNVTDNTESSACNEFHRTLLFTMINLSSRYAADIREMATLYSGKGEEMSSTCKCTEHNNTESNIDAHADSLHFCQVFSHSNLESISEANNCGVSHDNEYESLEVFVCGKYHPPLGISARSIEVYEVYTLSHEVITTIPELSILISQMCTIPSICNNGKEEISCNSKENVNVNYIEPKKELLYCSNLISEKLLELLYKNYVCSRTLCRVISPVEENIIKTTDTTTTKSRVNNSIALNNKSSPTKTDCNNDNTNSNSCYYFGNEDDSYNELEKDMLIKVTDNDEKMCEMCHAQCVGSPMEECMNSSEVSEESNGPTSDDHSVDYTFASIQESTNIIDNNDNNDNDNNFNVTSLQQRHNASRVASFIESSSESFMLSPSALELSEMSEVTLHSPFSMTEGDNNIINVVEKNRMQKYSKNRNYYNNKTIKNQNHSLCISLAKQSDYYKPTLPSSYTVEELLFSNSTAHTRCNAMAMSSLINNNKFYNHRVPIGWSRWAELCEELDRAFVVNLMDEIVHYCHCTRAAFYTAVGLLDHFVGVNHDPQYTTHKFTEELAHRATQRHYVKNYGATANQNIHHNHERVMHEQNHHIAPTEYVVDVSHMQDNYCNQVSHANPHYAAHTSNFYSISESSTTLAAEVAAHQEAQIHVANRKEEKWSEFQHHNEVRYKEIHSMGVKTLPPESSESIRSFFTQVIAVCCMLGCKFTDTYPPHVSKIMLCLRADNCFTPDAFTALELFVLKTLSYKTHSTTVNEVVDTLLDLIAPHFSTTANNNEVASVMVVHDSELHYSKLAHKWSTSVEEEVYRLKQIHESFTHSHYSSSSSSSTCNNESEADTMMHSRQEEQQQQQYFVAKQWNMFASVARYLCDEVIRGKRITLPVHKTNIYTKKEYLQNAKEEELMLRLSSEEDMNEVDMPFLSSSPCELGIAIIRAAAYFANYSLPPVLQKIDNASCTFASFCVEHIHNFHNYQTYYDNVQNSQKECIIAQSTNAAKNDKSYCLDNAAERQALLLYFAWLTATTNRHEVSSCVHDLQNANTSPCSHENTVSERIDKLERGIYDCFRDAQVKGIDSILRKRYSLLANMFKQN